MIRLNKECDVQLHGNEKEQLCISTRECTLPKLFSPMDIDGDMIKLFPTLDFFMEHDSNEYNTFYNNLMINIYK